MANAYKYKPQYTQNQIGPDPTGPGASLVNGERGILDNDDRDFFAEHYSAIAERLAQKRLWRGPWSVEVDGCVYKFTVKGYAKKGSAAWQEQQDEITNLDAQP